MTRWSKTDLLRTVRQIASALPSPDPPFDFCIGWSRDYDELLGRQYEDETAYSAIATRAQDSGRVVLHGSAGSGKTSIATRVFRDVADVGGLVVLIDLKRWSPPDFDAWTEWRGNEVGRFNLLLTRLGMPAVDETAFDAVGEQQRIVIVDGLNEITSQVANEILTSVDHFARRQPRAGVIVTDRLTRRELPSRHWQVARVQPLAIDAVEGFVDQPLDAPLAGLLRRPFFLDLALRGRSSTRSMASAVHEFLEGHVGLDDADLESVSTAAFRVYGETRSRTFPLDAFAATAGRRETDALIEDGLLHVDKTDAYFDHHLFHDFLAAHWLSGHDQEWGRRAFDAISFDASSFDALAMTLEQVPDTRRADELLRRIYDWNFYASAYALAEGKEQRSIAVSEAMEVALLANLAERKWDRILKTAQAVTDSLRFVPSDTAEAFLAADSFEELQAMVADREVDGDAEFEQWRELFLVERHERLPDYNVALLQDARSLVGWTAANTLRRADLSSQQQQAVRALLTDADYVVRWRAAHTLGAHADVNNALALLEALATDDDQWVLYGVIRALVELAALEQNLDELIVKAIVGLIPRLRSQPLTLYELSRAVMLQEPPPEWHYTVAPILDELAAHAETVEEQDRWRRLAFDLEQNAAAVQPA